MSKVAPEFIVNALQLDVWVKTGKLSAVPGTSTSTEFTGTVPVDQLTGSDQSVELAPFQIA